MNERDIARFLAKVDKRGPMHPYQPKLGRCHLWTGATDPRGYGRFFTSKPRKTVFSHRVAFFLAHGRWPIPQGCHSCDNPPCCNDRHIFEGTNAANVADMVAKGRSARGERQHHAKLSEAQALALLALRGTMTQREAGAAFGIAQHTVSRIWNGSRWAYLER